MPSPLQGARSGEKINDDNKRDIICRGLQIAGDDRQGHVDQKGFRLENKGGESNT